MWWAAPVLCMHRKEAEQGPRRLLAVLTAQSRARLWDKPLKIDAESSRFE
jgi:hypothetical protein